MNMNFKTLAAICAAAFAITGCSAENGQNGQNGQSSSESAVSDASDGDKSSSDNNISVNVTTKQATCTAIFSDGNISVDGKNAVASENTLTINGAGIFAISGTSADAKIVVNASDKDEVTLLFGGADLTSKNGAVIDCEKANKLNLISEKNTKNTLTDSTNYTFADDENEPDACVFSRCDTFYSAEESGLLTIIGNYGDAIKSKDGFTVESGTLKIKSADDGITGKDFVIISGGTITIDADGDGIKSTHDTDEKRGYVAINGGTITIDSANDGIQAETALAINGGKINVKAGGNAADAEIKSNRDFFDFDNRGERPSGMGSFPHDRFTRTTQTAAQTSADNASDSTKGLKAGKNIEISGGEITVTSADDSVHANGSVIVKNGTLLLSSCDDGIHADETLSIINGKITVTKSFEALEGKNIEISGGEIDVTATDDGLNAAGGDNGNYFGFNDNSDDYYISISGGKITVNANGDGLDSNGTIALSGGSVTIYGPLDNGNGAIDYEKSFAVSGGEMIALGSSGMAQAPGTLSQPCLSIYADVAENSIIEVRDSAGNVILSATSPKKCTSLIFTTDKFKSGENYSIYANNTLLSSVTAEIGLSGGGASAAGNFGAGRFPQVPQFR